MVVVVVGMGVVVTMVVVLVVVAAVVVTAAAVETAVVVVVVVVVVAVAVGGTAEVGVGEEGGSWLALEEQKGELLRVAFPEVLLQYLYVVVHLFSLRLLWLHEILHAALTFQLVLKTDDHMLPHYPLHLLTFL